MSLAFTEIDESTKVATVTINRPEALNALDVATAQALNDAIMPLQDRPDLRCILVRGAGRAFMAGGDVAAFAQHLDAADVIINQLLDALNPVVAFLYHTPVPVLACVQGAVAGAGISLMAACDLIIAADNTKFLIAYDKIGAPPDCGGTHFLPRQLGEKRAAAFMLLGETWSAEEAQAYGLINRVVASEELDTECQKLLAKLASGPTKAYSAYKTLVREGAERTLVDNLESERQAFCAATKTGDFKRGVTAFVEKSKAVYQGD
jgi:Enoyl-CoA hydratase/carnithine racemase